MSEEVEVMTKDQAISIIRSLKTYTADYTGPKLLAALRAIASGEIVCVRGWRPIESAPKDGTHVDLFVIDHAGKGSRRAKCRWKEWDEGDGFWAQSYAEIESFNNISDDLMRITHWMPIPEPPK